MERKLRPRCYFDIDIGHSRAGRIIFELYNDLCPRTVDNFIKLCTGECGIGETTKTRLHYLNTNFHRVIKGFMIQGGDFTNGDGTGGESIYGGRFADENLETSHNKPYMLSMANCGPNTNGSQFFITTKPTPHLDKKHVVFGYVLSGENLIESIENLPVNSNNKPVVDATIAACGELIPVRKKKTKKDKENCCKSSSEKDKKNKKSKKRKHKSKKKAKAADISNLEEINPNCSVRPDEIPEVPKPFFLYRGSLKEDMKSKEIENNSENSIENSQSKYISKDAVGRSGRIIKGRGQLRYLSNSPRSRSETPPHWKKQYQRSDKNVELKYITQIQCNDKFDNRKRALSKTPSDDKGNNYNFERVQKDRESIATKTSKQMKKDVISDITRESKRIKDKDNMLYSPKAIRKNDVISDDARKNNKRNFSKERKVETKKKRSKDTQRRLNDTNEKDINDDMSKRDSMRVGKSNDFSQKYSEHDKKVSVDTKYDSMHKGDYIKRRKSNDSTRSSNDCMKNRSNDSAIRNLKNRKGSRDSIHKKDKNLKKGLNYHEQRKNDYYEDKSNDSLRIKDDTKIIGTSCSMDVDSYISKTSNIKINRNESNDSNLKKNDYIRNEKRSYKIDIDKDERVTKDDLKPLNYSGTARELHDKNEEKETKGSEIISTNDNKSQSNSIENETYYFKAKSNENDKQTSKVYKKLVKNSDFDKHEKIIYDYGEESDDSLVHRKNEIKDSKRLSENVPLNQECAKSKTLNEFKGNEGDSNKKSSLNFLLKSQEIRDTHSPPAHLVAKWQNRRDKIMTRRSPITRIMKRSRHSPRRYSPRYSTSPLRNEKYVSSHHRSPHYKEKVSLSSKNDKLTKETFKRSHSSSGTIDSSPSSYGSSLITDNNNRKNMEITKQDCHSAVTDVSMKTAENDNKLTKEAEMSTLKDKNSETVMVIKPIEKLKILSQWKTEYDNADEGKQQSSILAKLRQNDEQKQKSIVSTQKDTTEVQLQKLPSPPISQSISKYRSPSGSREKESSSISFLSSSSKSSSRSRRRRRSESSHYRSRGARYHRGWENSRRSTSRSRRRRRYTETHSKSYSSSSSVSPPRRRHYSSRSRSRSSYYDRRERRRSSYLILRSAPRR